MNVKEFELYDIFECCSIFSMGGKLSENIECALKRSNIDGEVIIIPTCQSGHVDNGMYYLNALFEVFDNKDCNLMIGRGSVLGTFTVLDDGVFDDYGLEELELMSIEGVVELIKS